MRIAQRAWKALQKMEPRPLVMMEDMLSGYRPLALQRPSRICSERASHDQLSKKLRSFLDRLGCFNFRSAFASI